MPSPWSSVWVACSSPCPIPSCGRPAPSVNKRSPSACSTPGHCIWCSARRLCWPSAEPSLGWRRTLLFFGLACGLSLASELIGTGTGYPFGNYEYTSGLGYKILGRVPFSIPLSWFYMGLASYLLGGTLARWHPVWSVALGAYFLTVWDLVLDPAMAHPSLALNFWIWHQSGPYFGMPVQNFLGWTATGALFMGLSRWLWGATVPTVPPRFPLAVYALNMAVCDGAQRRWWRLAADRAGARVWARRRGAGHAWPAHETVALRAAT